MTFTPEQIKLLEAKLDRSNVKSRQQAGRNVSYIEAWHAIAEANRIFGFDRWNRETIELRVVSEQTRIIGKDPKYQKEGWGVSYLARVRITVSHIAREGVGVGHGIDADLGQAHESAVKEAESDAMKRALMTFGNQFGLALYDKEQSNVETTPPPQRTTSVPVEPIVQPINVIPHAIAVPLTPDGKASDWATWADVYRRSVKSSRDITELEAWIEANKYAFATMPVCKLKASTENGISNLRIEMKEKEKSVTTLPTYIGEVAETRMAG